jgi:hypothetical protein
MGIVIIELLISGASSYDPSLLLALQARSLVDTEGSSGLGTALEGKVLTESCWAQGKGRQASKILIDVAVSCVGPTSKRKTPAQVLDEVERAHKSKSTASEQGGTFFGW